MDRFTNQSNLAFDMASSHHDKIALHSLLLLFGKMGGSDKSRSNTYRERLTCKAVSLALVHIVLRRSCCVTLDQKAAFTIRDGLLDETGNLQESLHFYFYELWLFWDKMWNIYNQRSKSVPNKTQLITKNQSYSNIHNAIE